MMKRVAKGGDALLILQRRHQDALRRKALRMQIKAGIDALDRGEFVEIDDTNLEPYLRSLTAGAGKPAR